MLDFPLMLSVKLPVVNRIQPQSNKFATAVENKVTGVSKLNDSSASISCNTQVTKSIPTERMLVYMYHKLLTALCNDNNNNALFFS